MNIKEQAKDITETIKGGYIPTAKLTSYFIDELTTIKNKTIDNAIKYLRECNTNSFSCFEEFERNFRNAVSKIE